MFSRTQNYPVLVYGVDLLGGEARQFLVTDDKMESSEYSYSVQLKKFFFCMSENISCGLKITSPQDTVCDFLRRESAGPLGVKIEGLAMTVAGSLLV